METVWSEDMHLNRYNKIVLPLFFLMDLCMLSIIYFSVYYTYYHEFTKFFTQRYHITLYVALIAWAYLSIEFEIFKVERRIAMRGALLRLSSAYGFFVAVYFGFIVLMKLHGQSRLISMAFLILFYLAINAIVIFRYLYIFYYRSQGGNTLSSILFVPENRSSFRLEDHRNDFIRLGYSVNSVFGITDGMTASEVYQKIRDENFEMAFIVDPSKLPIDVDELVDICDNLGIRVRLMPGYLAKIGKRMGLDYIDGYPLMEVRNEPLLYLANRFVKRLVDLVISLLVVGFILSWLTVLIWIIQRFSGPGPVFFLQYRIGRDGKVFTIFKYRTMVWTPQNARPSYKGKDAITSKDDPRITRLGKFLRSTNLDELPQFLNVLWGDMSIVGPRPHMNAEDERLAEMVKKYPVRRFVKPGITGWAQIHGFRGGTEDLGKMTKRTEYDIYYLENWSLMLDMRIITTTTWQMLTFNIPNAY